VDKTLFRSLVAGVTVAILVTVFYLWLDRPISEAAFTLRPTIWHRIAKILSQAANGNFITGLLAAGFLVGGIDGLRNGFTPRSKSILYVCTVVAASIMIGNILKEFFGRARPPLLFEKGVYGFFPFAGDYMHFSFPSGHTLRIFSSMTALGLVFPRLRFPALTLAVLVGVSRVVALDHYPSDVLCGAFIGITAAIWGWRLIYPYGRPKSGL